MTEILLIEPITNTELQLYELDDPANGETRMVEAGRVDLVPGEFFILPSIIPTKVTGMCRVWNDSGATIYTHQQELIEDTQLPSIES